MLDHGIIEAVVLGAVQGVTEFLPISSDGHLVMAQELLKAIGVHSTEKRSHLHFDVMLHLGTLAAIVVVYQRELRRLLGDRRLMTLIVLASIPAGVAGLGFQKAVKEMFDTPIATGYGWLLTAVFLALGHRAATRPVPENAVPPRTLDKLNWVDALCIGFAQALAILPGVSRSGSTISTGLMRGVERGTTATFSFLMAVPVISGAILKMGKDVMDGDAAVGRTDALVVGIVVSFVVGLISLRWLLGVLSRGGLIGFAAYCAVAGLATIVWKWNG